MALLLTTVAYKLTIESQLPKKPYWTWLDMYIIAAFSLLFCTAGFMTYESHLLGRSGEKWNSWSPSAMTTITSVKNGTSLEEGTSAKLTNEIFDEVCASSFLSLHRTASVQNNPKLIRMCSLTWLLT